MAGGPAYAGDAREAWRSFLKRFPATATVDLILPDLAGIARGKRLTADAFLAGLEGELSFPISLYGIDATGANVDASGLVWEQGDADRPCLVDPATFAPVPWRDGGAQVLGGLGDSAGRPFFAAPRAVLQSVAERFAELGLTPVAALELEFFLLGPQPADGQPHAAASDPGAVYGLDPLDEHDAFLARLERYCASQELPAKSAVSEYAPAQFEINLGHVADPLRAADHAFLLKRAVKAAARAEGLQATFMAKPVPDQAASGMHVHVSLQDAQGNNRFALDQSALHHAIGGLQATMAEAMLLFSPNANSFRRLRPLSYAPTAPTWGHNNRTVALRVPSGAAAARRIEHRLAGADANPYLAIAASLACGYLGMKEKLKPRAPIEGSAYRLARTLPRTLYDALERFNGTRALKPIFGAIFVEAVTIVKGAELDAYQLVISSWEREHLLLNV
jgi:glutamine synthetase